MNIHWWTAKRALAGAIIVAASSLLFLSNQGILIQNLNPLFSLPSGKGYLQMNNTFQDFNSTLDNQTKAAFLIDSPGCRIPNFWLLDPSIRAFVRRSRPLDCSDVPPLTYIDGTDIVIDEKILERELPSVAKCSLWPIKRVNDKTLSKNISRIDFSRRISFPEESEQIHIRCFDIKNRQVYENFHWTFRPKLAAVSTPLPLSLPLNVILLGIDSTSRLNKERQLQRTVKYLKQLNHQVELLGYTKVGDNTFPNIVPLLSGIFVEDNRCFYRKDSFDECPLIFQNFSTEGYVTMLAEDRPRIAIFNFAKPGFKRPPTDHYLRPLMLSVESSTSSQVRLTTRECIGPRSETGLLLDYTADFLSTYAAKPSFTLTFITGRSHGDLNNLGSVDEEYLAFFRRLVDRHVLNNTVVFFFSDHGLRFGRFRQSLLGKVEDRLPFMHILLPPWFSSRHPDLMKNLRQNAATVTTPFDIHATIADVLHLGKEKSPSTTTRRNPYGISLFDSIPANRTCKDASVPPMWCACRILPHRLSPDDEKVRQAGKAIVRHINQLLTPHFDLCCRLVLDRVEDAFLLLDEKGNEITDDLLLTVRAIPGGGLFEAVVRVKFHSNQKPRILGEDLSRINTYGSQSHCIDVVRFKKYCFCKDMIPRR